MINLCELTFLRIKKLEKGGKNCCFHLLYFLFFIIRYCGGAAICNVMFILENRESGLQL